MTPFQEYGLFCYCKRDGMFWFRIVGYGLVIKDTRKRQLLFSERNGLKKPWRVGHYVITRLNP